MTGNSFNLPTSILDIIKTLPEKEQQTINILNALQEKYGYVPHEELQALADAEGKCVASLESLLSFFDSFRTRPAGRHRIQVCYGTACYARGAALIYDRIATEWHLDDDGYTTDGTFNVEKVACVGTCSQAPVIVDNDDYIGFIKQRNIPQILSDITRKDVKEQQAKKAAEESR